jgi:hypothetical protein
MTVPKPFVNSPSCRNPIGIGKSTSHDAHDGDDDELQRFSKGVEAPYFEMRDAVMGRVIGSTRPTKSDADAKSAPATLLQIYPLYSHRYSSPARMGFEQPVLREG